MNSLYYDRDGIPISTDDYCSLARNFDYKRVALTKLMDAAASTRVVDVSTVWLGIDHRFGDGPPLIFETMTFAEGSALDERCARYSTLAGARDGHTAMTVEVAATMTDPVVMEGEPLP